MKVALTIPALGLAGCARIDTPVDAGEVVSPRAYEGHAGAMVRGVVALRINPIPAGYEEFDAKNGG